MSGPGAESALVRVGLTDHDEYECRGCCTLAEYRIAFEKQITERIAAQRSDTAEAT